MREILDVNDGIGGDQERDDDMDADEPVVTKDLEILNDITVQNLRAH